MAISARPRFRSFDAIAEILNDFTLPSFSDASKVKRYAREFGIAALCRQLEEDRRPSRNSRLLRAVSRTEDKPFEFELGDLCRLHWLVLSRKCVSVLEFGSGFSTVIFSDALRLLNQFFHAWVKSSLRTVTPFHVHSVEEEQRFLDISLSRLSPQLRPYASFYRSSVELTQIGLHLSTLYAKLPNICPDLIYLDGPSQFATTEESRGFSFASPERMPMSADILTFEFFLQPGTLVVVDGRTANARFLKAHLKRNWLYHHDCEGDVHLFELQEAPLGPLNKKQLEFCLANRWLLPVG